MGNYKPKFPRRRKLCERLEAEYEPDAKVDWYGLIMALRHEGIEMSSQAKLSGWPYETFRKFFDRVRDGSKSEPKWSHARALMRLYTLQIRKPVPVLGAPE